jgi:hypothetical protein
MRKKRDDPKQYERFVVAARELGCDESEKAFERAFYKIVPVRSVRHELRRRIAAHRMG